METTAINSVYVVMVKGEWSGSIWPERVFQRKDQAESYIKEFNKIHPKQGIWITEMTLY